MMEWKDVTDSFTEKERHYKATYLEQDEVYGDEVEVSVFSSADDPYEIYFSYGRFYGIVYAEADKAYGIRDEMKKDLEDAYKQSKEPSDEFIGWFVDKYKVSFPNDIVFDFDLEKFLSSMSEIWD